MEFGEEDAYMCIENIRWMKWFEYSIYKENWTFMQIRMVWKVSITRIDHSLTRPVYFFICQQKQNWPKKRLRFSAI